MDTVGYNYIISFKRKCNNCFIKNRLLFYYKQSFFYSHFQGKHSRILLCSGAKKSREMWPKRSFTEAVAYVNLKCAVANLFPCSAYSKLVQSWNLLYEVVLRPPAGFAERELKLYWYLDWMKRVPCPYLLLVVASLRGMRKKKWEGGREKNAKSQIFFPFLPIPYPFWRPLRRLYSCRLWLYSFCHGLIFRRMALLD